ncbi:TetR/AcrR family transcriptional regulator [Agromyces atrinae]|uniref:AcrR family transcriptional regulator n=1 Tax=Agromyces atrinae TaxID=592376 RepID=A0A4Q2M5X1_9MICO|nr:hypothetical protein [Agromyces atrinae]NYD66361.1 AcrR family transcriptional regulator [Agromyces atrinae]RXZ86677.1 hypothetical protein ESP50_09855 [Agromyces atrinae]
MDPRARRTRERLRSAALERASNERLSQISVADVCRTAGVTRDTFYRHVSSVEELVADALAHEIAEATAGLPDDAAIGDGERVLLEHVRRRADVYRSAMDPVLAARVRASLEDALREGLLGWVERRPNIVPAEIAGDDAAMRMAIAYAAGGTIAAIEQWLRDDELDVERAVQIVLASSAAWWLL